ncbi:cell wall metabolism sensor histidine kinase WalK, partial [Lactobacillus sp. XV13L]|nr:cell wall metabolism sensor histidine kinase WalK [Lactobacillus sp. XV13L]
MNNKISFFRSIQFKIAAIFMLLLLITIEIIGAYFVHRLEQQNIETFEAQVQLPSYVTTSLANNLASSSAHSRRNVRSTINDISNIQNSDIEVIDSQGKIVAVRNSSNQNIIGQRTTNAQIKDVIYSGRKTTQISHNDRDGSYYLAITPLISSNGDSNTVVGAVYIRADMDQVYKSINS